MHRDLGISERDLVAILQTSVDSDRFVRTPVSTKPEVRIAAILKYRHVAFVHQHPGSGQALNLGHAGDVVPMTMSGQEYFDVRELKSQ